MKPNTDLLLISQSFTYIYLQDSVYSSLVLWMSSNKHLYFVNTSMWMKNSLYFLFLVYKYIYVIEKLALFFISCFIICVLSAGSLAFSGCFSSKSGELFFGLDVFSFCGLTQRELLFGPVEKIFLKWEILYFRKI